MTIDDVLDVTFDEIKSINTIDNHAIEGCKIVSRILKRKPGTNKLK
jgi:hypothetical protein